MANASPLVQYIVVRTDLITRLGWTMGAVIAQACHATTAATLQYREDEQAQQYFEDVNNMHKVVLGISSETKLLNLSKRLADFYVEHRVWTEQPENTPTCLVTKPAPKDTKAEFFKKLQLFRTPGDKSKTKKKNRKFENDGSRSEKRGDDDSSDLTVQHYRGSGDMSEFLDNDGDNHSTKKHNGSGKSPRNYDGNSHGREQRSRSGDSHGSRKKRNNDENSGHDQRSRSGDSNGSLTKMNSDDRSGHDQRSGSGDNRGSRKKKDRDNHDDDGDKERAESGESGKGRRGYEGQKDHNNHNREDRKERHKEKEKNDVDEATDRMSTSPKLPPISKRVI